MVLELADWEFWVDVEATRAKTSANALDHCTCAYCRNYYEAVEHTYPGLPAFLGRFGVNLAGPSELMPFEPTYLLACYKVMGRVLRWGSEPLSADGVPIAVGAGEEGIFQLWVGEVSLPWLQSEPVEEVVSPANLPEFLERMQEMWSLRHGEAILFS